jgi:prepilin-type N-terminal cleavage/methylation domain-containing protein
MRKIKPIKRTGLPFTAERRKGLTLIELIVASAMATICMLAVGGVFSDTQKAWNVTYSRAHEPIMVNSHLANKAFEATVRKASCEKYKIDTEGHWVEVYYFASDASATTDRYAKMYVEDGTFYIENGVFNPRETLETTAICSTVTDYLFSGSGRCIRMRMTLSDDNSDVNFISSAVPQNQ